MRSVNLSGWAGRVGVSKYTACRWYNAGTLPVPAGRAGRVILAGPGRSPGAAGRVVVCACVWSAGQRCGLGRLVARLSSWVTADGMTVGGVVTETGSAVNGRRRKLARTLAGPDAAGIVVEHRDGLARFGTKRIQAGLAARGRQIVILDLGGIDDGLVRDMSKVLAWFCADIRADAISKLTTALAKTHGMVVVETLNSAGMLAQKGLPGARSRRRKLADAGLAQARARLRYKQAWYGCRLIEADRFYPSSQICSACDRQTAIGWAAEWDCPGCGAHHHRDDNAAVNLARYLGSGWQAVGPVGSRVKRRAGGKTGPGPARGVEAPNPNPDRGAA